MEQVASGIYRLGRKRHNFYLIVEKGQATVIDAGGSWEYSILDAALTQLALTLDDIVALLITHAHPDHIGFAQQVADRGVSVKVHEPEAAFARDRGEGSQMSSLAVPIWKPKVILFLAEMFRAGAHRSRRLTDFDTVEDGELLDLPGTPRVVATPGHTAGHASYLLEGQRILCSGDALVTSGLIHAGEGPQMLPDVFHTDPALARESAKTLAQLPVDLLLPGHGVPWKGPIADTIAGVAN
ncbi:MAG: MBL fold metallo-hydrolase [bacterium]|nr:MBL fold metallo-hydrolase [bacterium]